MKYLFIDTETTGVPKEENLSLMITDNWPRLVSFAYILCDERDIVDSDFFIIKPNKFIIPIESTKNHGITTAEAISKGVVLSEVLDIIKPLIEECDFIIGHNVKFDINVINAEFYRYDKTMPASLKPYYCTMMLSKDYCGLPNSKYPTLEELSTILRGDSFTNVHNALADAQTAMECFWILLDSGIANFQTEKPIIKIYPTEDNISWAGKHVTKDYATKAHAFFTIASNLKNNKYHFLDFETDRLYFETNLIDSQTAKSTLDSHNTDCRSIKIPDSDQKWINDCFDFSKIDLGKSYSWVKYNIFDKSKTVVTSPFMKSIVKSIKNEIGLRSIFEKYQLNHPEGSCATLILEDESSWIDIAVQAVNYLIQQTDNIEDTKSSHADADEYFISMIKDINEIRSKETVEKLNKFSNDLEKAIEEMKNPSEEGMSIINGTWMLPDYKKPSSSGCMLFLYLLVGIVSSLYYLL